jgi:hypothetical protein
MYKFHKILNNIDFYAPSTKKNKKYDAIINNKKYSFGSILHDQFFDKIGFYHMLNHYDLTRRANYRKRHKNNKKMAGLLSLNYLW